MSITIFAAMKEVIANPTAEGLARIKEMIENWEAKSGSNTLYYLTAYREDGVDSCRGCIMARSGSDFQTFGSNDETEFVSEWANLIHFDMTHDLEYCDYEYTLTIDGIRYDSAKCHPLYDKAKALVADIIDAEKKKEEERAQRSKIAAEEARIKQEKAQLAALLSKYGTDASN